MKRSYGLMTDYVVPDTPYGLRPRKRYRSARLANDVVLAPATRVAVDREIKRINRRQADKSSAESSSDNTTGDGIANGASGSGYMRSALAQMTQGDSSENNFAGESITPLGYTIRYQMQASTDEGDFTTMRFLVLQYFGNDAASIQGVSYFLGNVGGARAPLSPKQWDHRSSFKILADTGPVTLQHNSTNGQGGGVGFATSGTLYIPGRKMRKVFFNADGTLSKNDISVLCISDSAPGTNLPVINWIGQLIYTDV